MRDIVVIGASAGGVTALQELVTILPADLRAAIFIVLHMPASAPSHLAGILKRHTVLSVTQAIDGEPILEGHVYVSRPDYHLVLDEKSVHLTRGPRENRQRPAVDALFRSAAFTYAQRVIGIVLTGELDDGTAGLWAIKERGGTTVVQDPGDAQAPSMPRSALEYVQADHVVPMAEMGRLLVRLIREPPNGKLVVDKEKPAEKELAMETRIAREGRALQLGVMDLGAITPYTCPECHGALVALKGGGVPRFRCHTGHAYSINNLLAAVTEYVEESLWNTIRSIEESVMLLNHLGQHMRETGQDAAIAELFDRKANDTQRHADLVRQATMEHQTLSKENVAEVEPKAR
jgi:two-component system chemotaxis response regulator CheB